MSFLCASGHGGRLVDQNGKELQRLIVLKCTDYSLLVSHLLDSLVTGDEEDGYDETLIPVDFQQHGQIRDDDLLRILVHPLKKGVTMTCLMDCCHSGTVLDLPYRFTADGDKMVRQRNFDFGTLMGNPEAVFACACCLLYLLPMLLE